MFDLIETAEKIIELVDAHCEPSICKVKECEKCVEIKQLRYSLSKEDDSKKHCGKTNRYIYSLWKNGKLISQHNVATEVSSIIGCSANTVRYMVENGNKNNGYTVTRELRELEEVE